MVFDLYLRLINMEQEFSFKILIKTNNKKYTMDIHKDIFFITAIDRNTELRFILTVENISYESKKYIAKELYEKGNIEVTFTDRNTQKNINKVLFVSKTLQNKDFYKEYFKHPIIIGHRGSGADNYNKKNNIFADITENTIDSFNNAHKLNVDWIEFDVQLTKDKILVIYHDFNFNGIPVNELNFFEIKEKMKNICTLEDVFKKVPADIGFNIEIKYDSKHKTNISPTEFLSYIIEICQSYNRKIFFTSFDPDILVLLRNSGYPLFLLFESLNYKDIIQINLQSAYNFVKNMGFHGLILDSNLITTEIEKMNDIIIFAYGDKCNSKKWIKKFIKYGLSGIITDDIKNINSSVFETN
ncbi:Glycerophosphoryl diester phosphodiesterase [Spraguea lophii 42_110]|uniref:Glycerophosphoryl diester phosphodiesterase n=1 Tax=Spraguea lophii (strain 42_110) TaxID=1358809 RepID=S7XKI2_SPRLO|nr:Glycerophosphoryl diester phosphodiesterase [Spraguea lophii 42_110]